MLKALDSVASVDPAKAKAAGYHAIGRYLTGDNPLTRAELETYTAADFWVFALFEVSTSDIQGGQALGAKHATEALAALAKLDIPSTVVATVFLACDTDPAGLPGGPADAVPYYRGASALRDSGHRLGSYIGAKGANALLGAGVIDRVMIPNATAWNDGATPKRQDIKQGLPAITIDGQSYDPDEIYTADVLWNLSGNYYSAPKPTPEVTDVDWTTLKSGDDSQAVVALQGALKAIGRYPNKANGRYGPDTVKAVKLVQTAHKLAVTGECDGRTLLAIFGEK